METKFVSFKSTKEYKDKSNRNVTVYTLDEDNAAIFLEKVATIAQGGKQVKIAVTTTEKEGQYGKFLSSFCFVDPVVPKTVVGRANGSYVPKSNTPSRSSPTSTGTKMNTPTGIRGRTLNTEVE